MLVAPHVPVVPVPPLLQSALVQQFVFGIQAPPVVHDRWSESQVKLQMCEAIHVPIAPDLVQSESAQQSLGVVAYVQAVPFPLPHKGLLESVQSALDMQVAHRPEVVLHISPLA